MRTNAETAGGSYGVSETRRNGGCNANIVAPACCKDRFMQRAHHRRGVAMLLVLISVAVVTVVTMSYLASRDSTPDISRNIVGAIEARFIAETGIDLATAIMEVEAVDWRTIHNNGVILDNYAFGGGTITITIEDLDGDPPASDAEYALVHAVGRVGGLEQEAESDVYAPIIDHTVDVDLSEFALFADDQINIRNNSMVAPWRLSPRYSLGEPVRLGVNATSSDKIYLRPGSHVFNGIGYVRGDAASSVIRNNSGSGELLRQIEITATEPLPIPDIPTPYLDGLTWITPSELTISSNTITTLTTDRRRNSITINGSRLVTYQDGHRVRVYDGNLNIINGGAWIVAGSFDIIVLGDVNILGGSAINVPPGGHLRLFIGGTLTVDDSALGLSRTDLKVTRTAANGIGSYRNPANCEVFNLSSLFNAGNGDLDTADEVDWSDGLNRPWTFTNRSFVCATLYGTNKAEITFDSGSALFGNAVGDRIDVRNGSVVHYDHELDTRDGYTNPQSDLFAADGDLSDALVAITTDLDDSTLAAIDAEVQSNVAVVLVPPTNASEASSRKRGKLKKRRMRRIGRRKEEN